MGVKTSTSYLGGSLTTGGGLHCHGRRNQKKKTHQDRTALIKQVERTTTPMMKGEASSGPSWTFRQLEPWEPICYRCGTPVLISRYCLQWMNESWIGEETLRSQLERSQENTYEMMDFSFGHQKKIAGVPKPMVDAKIGPMIIPTVINSGCAKMMLKAGVVPSQLRTEDTPVSMLCMHRESYTYPRQCFLLAIMGRTEELAIGIVQNLPCPVLLGQDWPYFPEVLDQPMDRRWVIYSRKGREGPLE